MPFDTHTDYFMQHKASFADSLFELAKSDIEQGVYFHA